MGARLVPHLIIGLGGQGLIILNKIKKLAIENHVNPEEHNGIQFPLVEYLGIDSTLHDLQKEESHIVLDSKYEIILVNTERAKEVFEKSGFYESDIQQLINDPEITKLAKEKFKEITAGCGGYPLICRVAGFLEIDRIANILRQKLLNLTAVDRINDLLQKGGYLGKYSLSKGGRELNIYIINSLSGGTGRGLYELISFLAKKIAADLIESEKNVKVMLFSLMPSVFSLAGKDLAYVQANAYAAVKEIDYFLNGNYRPENYAVKRIGGGSTIESPIDFFIPVGGIYSTADGTSAGPAFLSLDEARHSVAKFITDSIFTGVSSSILGEISNLDNIQKQLIERETGKERIAKYFRIMYSSLVLPVEDMFEYSATMLKHTLLLDLLGGTLEPPEDIEDRVLNKVSYVEMLLDRIRNNASVLDTQKTKIEGAFYYANFEAISNSFKNFVDGLKKSVDTQKSNIPVNAKGLVSSLRNEEFIKVVKVYGLEGLSSILEDVIKGLKKTLADRLGKTTLVLDLSSEISSIKHEIDNNIREIEQIADKKVQFLSENVFNKYEGLTGIIRKLLRGGRLNPEDESTVNSEIRNFNGNIASYIDKIKRGLQDYYLIHIIQALEEYKGVIDSEIKQVKEILERVDSILKDIERKSYGQGKTKLILKNRQEGKIVFDALMDYINSLDKIDYLKKYDKEFMEEELYTHYIASHDKPHNLDYKGELEKILDKLSKDFYEKLEEKLEKSLKIFYVIYNYLSKKATTMGTEIRDIIAEPLKKFYFWGSIMPMKEKEGGKSATKPGLISINILSPKRFAEDENYERIKSEIENVLSMYSKPNFSELDEHFPENQILVLGYHMGLAGFMFSDIQESRGSYIKEPLEQRKLRHIKPEFVYFPEPVDISENIDDFYYLLNIAYQIKAIKGNLFNVKDEDKIAQIQGKSIKYEPLKVKTVDGNDISVRHIYEGYGDEEPLFSDLIDKISKAIVDKFFYFLIKLPDKSREFKRLKDFLCPEVDFRNQKEKVIPFTPGLVMRLRASVEDYSLPDDRKAMLRSWLNCYDYSLAEAVKRDKTFKFCKNVYVTTQTQKKVGLFIFPYE